MEDQILPVEAMDEDIQHAAGDDKDTKEEEEDTFVYLKSSSIISILIIVIISLVCILTTSLLIRTALRSHGITRTLSIYFGFTPNRTVDESILTFWEPQSIHDEQPIETTTAIMNSSSPPPPVILSEREKKAQKIFRNIILPVLLFSSIFCGILAFYLRLRHHHYPAWGARPKRPEQHVTLELNQAQTKNLL